ncbi:MAG: TIGR02436 family protein [Microgenomates group bacterium GW2011_GWC1_37_8]|uniref:TIGR02436 family protein n=1 Tax=Candidatus Woesebacteria bacterium GW2011_GWB1_38_8 TaxID=1618570 RepID=A0A0G0KZ91_9BACT|nr:MAG: TIGR02436 family protein [Microgenomates group bacterium GW2011_GWC1_37_8]KKQ85003.1 MAG: TIGR02436 family protein [Candidatus Woesebacteria bacterium GW2011_GWB1_38_8]
MVIKIIRYLPRTEENLVVIKQILRSVTSMGANSQEADGASSKKDFLHCFTTVRKEAKETEFWLKLIVELNLKAQVSGRKLIEECRQIIAIVSKIISNTRN